MLLNWQAGLDLAVEAPIRLASGEIHLWCAALDGLVDDLETIAACLAADEIERAASYRFERDRRRYRARRGLLRILLQRYLDVPASRLLFCTNAFGKPALVPGQTQQAIEFNLSHSNGIALFAITLHRHVGIDIEALRSDVEILQIAARFFSPLETKTLAGLPPEEQLPAFFRCWTRKEAYVKARGQGLSLALDSFDVTLAPRLPAVLLGTRPNPQDAKDWELLDLDPAPGYLGALAFSRSGAAEPASNAAPPRVYTYSIPGDQSPAPPSPKSHTI
jgi:4'-phosphopantetheinyl transferase